MRERDIESWAGNQAKKAGWWHRKFKAPGRRSAPDRVFARTGRIFFVEFKATGEKPTELQEEEHKQMRAAGLTVYWTDCREGFKFILEGEGNVIPFSDWAAFPGYGVTLEPDGKFRIHAVE